MGQIVKKKKGRPSKADLAARAAAESNAGHRSHHRRDTAEEERRDARRSLRRRSFVRYDLIDYDDDDYLDDDDDEFEFDEDDNTDAEDGGRKREKKLKFVLKLPNCSSRGRPVRSNGGCDSVIRARGSESEGEGDEEEEEIRVVKKRKISRDMDEEDEVDDNSGDNDEEEERGGKRESYKMNFDHGYFSGTLNDDPSETPMPEKKQLELMLDKLQKKDTYGVYAEPVDPEELPDYHDIIKQPMDFATLRKKLADGSYSIFEKFESDVYLLCSNAMKYNAPDTVYHKQALSIKELAQKKFQRVRHHIERTRIENELTEKEANSEAKMTPNPIIKKQVKKPVGRSIQDHVGSDFSYGATLATTDAHNASNGVQTKSYEIRSNNEELVEGISSLPEENVQKVEDLQSGKGTTPKLGRKPLVADENRRETYKISNQPVDTSESICSTFESEDKQLIPVGLYGEHSYSQSLARFAATLGPGAWRAASKRIEQALPPESKFGRGWVVEYEPIFDPVLFVAGQSQKEYSSAKTPPCPAVSVKTDMPTKTLVGSSEQLGVGESSLNGKQCFLPSSGGSRPATPSGAIFQQNPFVRKLQHATIPVKGDKPSKTTSPNVLGEYRLVSDTQQPQVPNLGESRPTTTTCEAIQQQYPFVRKLQNGFVPVKTNESLESVVTTSGRLDSGSILEGKSSVLPNSRGSKPLTPTGAVIQPLNPFSTNNSRADNPVKHRVEAYTPTPNNQKTNPLLQNHHPGSAEVAPPSWQVDTIARNRSFLQSAPLMPPSPASEGVVLGRTPIENGNGSVDINRMASSPSSGVSTQVFGTKTSFQPRSEQGLSDPVQATRLSAENAQKQLNKMNNLPGPLQSGPSIQSLRVDNMSRATTAAGAWMHASTVDMNRPASGNLSSHSNQIPADSLYNKTWEIYPQFLHSGEYPVSGTRHFQPERGKVPFEELASNPSKASNEAQVRNRPMVTDPSRIPLQSPRQGLSRHTEQKKKWDTLPPDLNVAFQSSVDPQQPDLALQL